MTMIRVLGLLIGSILLPRVSPSAAGTETLIGLVGEDFVLLGADSSLSQSIALTASNLDKIGSVVDPFPAGRSSMDPHGQQTIAAAAAGDAADADRLLGLLTAQAALREYAAGIGGDVDVVDSHVASIPAGLSVEDVAYLARGQIAQRLRSAAPYRVCLLVAGMMPPTEGRQATRRLIPSLSTTFASERVQQQVQRATDSYAGRSTEPKAALTESVDSLLAPCLYWLDEYGSIQRIQYGAHGYGSNFCLSILDQAYHPKMTRQEAIAVMRECFAQLRVRYVINSPQPPCIKCIDAHGCRLIPLEL